MCAVFNITINSKERLRCNFVTERFDFRDKFEMGVHLAHLLARTKVNSKVHNVLLEDVRQPIFPFVGTDITKACLNAYRKASFFGNGNNVSCEVWSANKPAASPTFNDRLIIYHGELNYEVSTQSNSELAKPPCKIMMNVGNPDMAFTFAQTPNDGVGLARLEFVINNMVGIHPKAILNVDAMPKAMQATIHNRARGYASPKQFYIDKIAEGVATIAAAFYPKPVIVRTSDFKSNEYKKLVGGDIYEPDEENPMIGFRGAARYMAEDFKECFAMECQAMKKVRDELGLTNVELMIPFVRTLDEARAVTEVMAENGLKRGENGLRLIMMCEIPANALLAEQFLEYFDGFSIGSNDLTQLTLGMDRDSGILADGFDERNDAVKELLKMAISTCNRLGKYVGICGQGPSDHEDFAEWLVKEGIQSVSLNPDTVVATWQRLTKK